MANEFLKNLAAQNNGRYLCVSQRHASDGAFDAHLFAHQLTTNNFADDEVLVISWRTPQLESGAEPTAPDQTRPGGIWVGYRTLWPGCQIFWNTKYIHVPWIFCRHGLGQVDPVTQFQLWGVPWIDFEITSLMLWYVNFQCLHM